MLSRRKKKSSDVQRSLYERRGGREGEEEKGRKRREVGEIDKGMMCNLRYLAIEWLGVTTGSLH
jgi:hypothetical protein